MKTSLTNTWTTQLNDAGEFVRRPSTFRRWIEADAGAALPAAADRYHLYVSLACPWAHRTLIARKLKGLEDVITVDVVDHLLTERGWTFEGRSPGATRDRVHGFSELRQVYLRDVPDYAASVTVPVLYDKREGRIVNNESSEILRMLDGAFQAFARHPEVQLYPEPLRAEIDAANEWIYPAVNDGVYKCGFARTQAAYDKAVSALFAGLDRAEAILEDRRFLVGALLTEADVRLFTTLVRFDLVYHTHFKCNVRRLVDYPNLWRFVRDVYGLPGIAETVDVFHIKHHYYESHRTLNPSGIVPAGPAERYLFVAPDRSAETMRESASSR